MEETDLLVAIETLLGGCHGPEGMGGAGGVVEQCLCVLVNLSTCCEKTRNILVHCEEIGRSLAAILVRRNDSNCSSNSSNTSRNVMLVAGC